MTAAMLDLTEHSTPCLAQLVQHAAALHCAGLADFTVREATTAIGAIFACREFEGATA